MKKLFSRETIMDKFEAIVAEFDEKGWSVVDRMNTNENLPQVALRNDELGRLTVLELIEVGPGTLAIITTDEEIAKFVKKDSLFYELIQ